MHTPKTNALTSSPRIRRLQWWATGVYALLLLIASVLPGSNFPKIPNWNLLFAPDKWMHFGAYGVFALLLSAVFTGSRIKRAIPLAIFVSALYGVLMEVLQGISGTGRSFDTVDMVANLIGSILGGVVFYFLHKFKSKPATTVEAQE